MTVRWLVRLVGVGIFLALLSRLDLARLTEVLARANPLSVLLAIALVVPFFMLKSWRWQILLQRAGIEISVRRSLWLYFVGLFAGYATPGQVGEAVKAVYLVRSGHPLGPALATIALDRILDLLLLVILAVPGVALLGEALGVDRISTVLFLLGSLAALVLGLWLITHPKALAPALRLVAPFPALREKLGRLLAQGSEAVPGFGAITRSASLWLLTIAAYVVHYARFYLLLLAMNVAAPPPLLAFVAALAVVSVVALLPITIMGVGTRDGVLVLAAGGLGLTAEEAVGYSLLILVTYLANLVIGLGCWLSDKRMQPA